jgi:hypothetical protein
MCQTADSRAVNVRLGLTAGGVGLTTLLVVGGLLTAVLPFEFSAIVGLPVGVLAGLAALAGVIALLDRVESPLGRGLAAYGTVGYAVLGYAALSYVNLGGLRGTLTTVQVLGLGAVAGVAVFGALRVLDNGAAGAN